jgi:cell division protein FtsW (lipid II flippase)
MFSQPDWGIFWPVFAVALPVLFWKGGARERALACAVVAMIAMDHIIFYFSNKDIAVLIEQSYTRLLVQLAPAAVLVSIIGYQYVVAGKLNAEQAGAE